MAKKKQPTFGQHNTPFTLNDAARHDGMPPSPPGGVIFQEVDGKDGKRHLVSNFGPSVSAASYRLTNDGYIRRADDTLRYIEEQGKLMWPSETQQLASWAVANPTVDPRTYLGLAKANIDPFSTMGQDISVADIARQVDDGTFDKQSINYTPTGAKVTPGTPLTAGPTSPLAPVQNDQGPLASFMSEAVAPPSTLARAAQYGMQSGYDAMQAGIRTGLGEQSNAMAIAKQYGLSEAEANIAFPQSGQQQALAGKNLYTDQHLPDVPFNPAWVKQDDGGGIVGFLKSALTAVQQGMEGNATGDVTMPGSITYDNLVDERKALIDKARAQFNATRMSTGDAAKSVLDQTPVGQIIKNPELLTNDNGILASNPAVWEGTTAAQINPATGQPYTQDSQGTDAASVQAYDMRTIEEIAMGVEPIGWTPGRGIAHLKWSPAEQEFHTASGVIDFMDNLAGDPVNLVPIDAPVKVARGVTTGTAKLVEAFGRDSSYIPGFVGRGMRGTKGVVVQTGIGFAPEGKAAAYFGAPEGARGAQRIAESGITSTVADPDLLARAKAKDLAEGVIPAYSDRVTPDNLVATPSGGVLMKKNAFDMMNSARGKKIVQAIADEKSATKMWLRSNRHFDPVLAKQLADADTPEQVRAILGPRMGVDLDNPAALGGFTSTPAIFSNAAILDHPVMQYLRKGPHVGFNQDDPLDTVTQLERFGRGAGLTTDQIATHIDNWLDAGSDPAARYAAIYGDEAGNGGLLNAVADRLVNDVGVSPGKAKDVTSAMKGAVSELMRDYSNSAMAAGTMGASADGLTGSPLTFGEMLGSAGILPNYRTVRRIGSTVAKIERKIGGGNISETEGARMVSNFIADATTMWKSSVLIRPAYIAREVGEMQVAAGLAGYSSVLTHPGRFLGLVAGTMAQKEASGVAGRLADAVRTGTLPVNKIEQTDTALRVARAEGSRAGVVGRTVQKAGQNALYGLAAAPKAIIDQSGITALKDYLHFHHGMSTFFQGMPRTYARLSGDGLYDDLPSAFEQGEGWKVPELYQAMNAGSEMALNQDMRLGVTARKQGIDFMDKDKALKSEHNTRAYVNGLIDKLQHLAMEPDYRNLADPSKTMQDAVRHFQDSGRARIAREANPDLFGIRSDSEFLEGLADILRQATGGDDAGLTQAIAENSFAGMPLSHKNSALRLYIRSMLEDETKRAGMLQHVRYDASFADATLRSKTSDAINRFFLGVGEISDLLARGPLVRESYVNHAVSLVPHMTPAAKAEAVRRLARAGDTEQAKRLLEAGKAEGWLHLDEADHIIGHRVKQDAERTFYNAHEQQNYALAVRAVMPFAQATFNTFRRWGEFSMRNPQLMYRTMKPFVYGQQPGSATIYGLLGGAYGDDESKALFDPATYAYQTPDHRANHSQGFFFTDQYGDQKFAYPMIGPLGQFAGVIPKGVLPTSSMSGLNVAGTSIFPGFGPVVTLPASLMSAPQEWMDQQGWVGDVMRGVFPYGLPQGSNADKMLASISPSWLNKVNQGSDDQFSVPNMAAKLVPVLISTGDYDLSKASDQTRLAQNASDMASRLYKFNAIFGSFTASTINSTMLVKPNGFRDTPYKTTPEKAKFVDSLMSADPQNHTGAVGNFIRQDILAQEWNRYTSGPGADAYRNGMLNFVHDFGTNALMSVLPRTTSTNQATNDLWGFQTQNPDTYQNYNKVIGLFFAGGTDSNFAPALYSKQKKTGERSVKQPETYVNDAMKQIGWMIWNAKADEIDASNLSDDDKAAQKSDIAHQITEFTGGYWSRTSSDPNATGRQIVQVRQALDDPAIQTIPSASYVKEYLDYRDALLKEASARGTGDKFSTKENEDLARELLGKAAMLRKQDTSGGFSNMYHQVFASEFGN